MPSRAPLNERTSLSRLQFADESDQQVLHNDWRPPHSLDGICAAIPGLEPKLIILTARIPAHVEEEPGQFITFLLIVPAVADAIEGCEAVIVAGHRLPIDDAGAGAQTGELATPSTPPKLTGR